MPSIVGCPHGQRVRAVADGRRVPGGEVGRTRDRSHLSSVDEEVEAFDPSVVGGHRLQRDGPTELCACGGRVHDADRRSIGLAAIDDGDAELWTTAFGYGLV